MQKSPFFPLPTLGLMATLATLGIATAPAHAWKPKTHIYLAEQALKDALDNGKVTIYETNYRTGKVVGVLGEFPVDPRILAALKASPKQFRAGVLGPDAYPDITTGQCLIHPHQASALDGQVANGTNSWLTHIWNLTYGPVELHTGTPTRAFAVGYLTHAAGDLFAHTFMNHFSGGEFMLQPDPRNALKHLVLEGYIGKRTPLTIDTFGTAANLSADAARSAYPGSLFPSLFSTQLAQGGRSPLQIVRDLDNALVTENDISIEGLENFLAGELTYGRPGSVLYDKLLNVPERKKSLPYLFSTLRNSLQGEVDRYNKLSKFDKAKYTVTHPGRITFIEHWIKDIDKGLIQWPKTSHELAKALVYNETGGGADLKRAKEAINSYVKNYLVYMGPVPDIAVDALKFMGAIFDALVPDFIKDSIKELVRDFQNWVIEKATGKTLDEWADYIANPETHFDPILNAPGGARSGRTAQNVTLETLNRDYLKLNDTGYSPGTTETFQVENLPPAFNTLQMCKLLLLNKAGVNQVLDALAARGVKRPALPNNFENVMLGWHQSLDNDNQWQGLASRDSNPQATLVFAQDGGATYQHLFMKQVGEVDWVRYTAEPPPGGVGTGPSTPQPAPAPPSPEAINKLFAGLKGTWQTTRGTVLTITDAETTDGSLKLRGAAVKGTTRLETIYLDAETETRAGGQWAGQPSSSSIAVNGRVTLTLSADGNAFTGLVVTQDGAQTIYNGTRVKSTPTEPTPKPEPTGSNPGENSGVVPPKPSPARIGDGNFYALDQFDVRVDKVQYGRADTLEVFVTYRNHRPHKLGVTAGGFTLIITDADGVGLRDMGNLYRVGGDDPVRIENTIWLEGGESCRIRYIFKIPKGTEALKKLSVDEYNHTRTFELSGLTPTQPPAQE